VGTLIFKAHREKVTSGMEGLVGMKGEAKSDMAQGKEGSVFLNWEYWNALAEEEIKKGDKVEVVSAEGLVCRVKKV
jgi:membrane-bound ClpP family serine protease